jgi:murein DD-endopeptidase MepM/ murein hydrolase activator NlpD
VGAPPPSAPPPTGVERRALTVSSPSEIQGVLTGAGVLPAEAESAANAASAKMPAAPGDLTVVMMLKPATGGYRLVSLDVRHDDGAGVLIQASDSGALTVAPTAADLKTVVKVVRGEMDAYSFYTSAVSQHLTDSLISPFAQALAYDFDFQREVHAGDVFEAAFEDRENAKGQSVGVGRLLYVSMETPAKSRALYWFQPPGGQGGWFDGNGASTVRTLMRTPVEGARISSTFGMREHPVLGFMKMHKGVDFAAPIGTPIYAAGDGVVENAEFKDLNGNYVKIRHDNGWETIYLHMSAFGPGIAAGVHVHQGQQIGQIGTTGRSTGPHLHYELHINNEPVDPMSIKMEGAKPLDGASMAAFIKERNRIDALRVAQTS